MRKKKVPTVHPSGPQGWVFPAVFYGILALLAFSRCLLFGQAYFDNDLLAQFGPWRAFLKDQLAQGHFPLWDPYLLGGQPFFADLQNMMFYPFNYLTLPFSVPYGLGVFFFIHMFWSAWGMHLWLRSLGLCQAACRMGALLFAFSGFFWLEIIHPPVLAAFSWLPWLLFCLEKLSKEPRLPHAFYSGFAFAMLFLCGSFQVTVGAIYGGAAYFLFRLSCKWKDAGGFSLSLNGFKTFFILGLFLLWGALPLLGQLIPTLEFFSLSDRGSAPLDYGKLEPNLSLDPAALFEFWFPRLALPSGQSMAEAVQSHDSTANLSAAWGYLGVWAPFLALLAFRRKQDRTVYFFASFAILALLLCLGHYTPFHPFFYRFLPGFSWVRVPFRFLYLFILPMVALAAIGLDEALIFLKKTLSLQRIKIGFFGLVLALYVVLAGLMVFLFPAGAWRELMGWLLGVAGMAFVFLSPSRKGLGLSLFNLGVILPLFLNGWSDYVPGSSSNFDYAGNSKSICGISQHLGPYRAIYDNQHMYYPVELEGRKFLLNYPQDCSCALKAKNFGGYNPLMLQVKRDSQSLPMETLIRMGAIKGIITQQDHGEIPGFKKESFPPYLLYDYEKPLPYVFEPGQIVVVQDREKRLETLSSLGFDPYRTVLLSEPLTVEMSSLPQGAPFACDYRIAMDEPEVQTFIVHCPQKGLVVFAETMYPGWKAWVDGHPTPVLTADHLLRALYLQAGHHRVDFCFEPDWPLPILVETVLWTLLTLGGFLFGKRLWNGTDLA